MASAMNLTATSLGAASMVTQNFAVLSNNIQAAAWNPTPATISNEDQSSTQAQFSMDVLKRSLDVQSTTGTELAQMINMGSSVDIQA